MFMPGMGAPIQSPPAFQVEIVDTDTSPVNTNNPTFASMDAGNPRQDRYLIAAIHFQDDDETDVSYSVQVLINDVLAERAASSGAAGSGRSDFAAIYIAPVPEGENVDVEVSVSGFGGTIDEWGCTLMRVTGLDDDEAIDTDTEAAGDAKVVLVPAGAGFAVVVAADIGTDLSARTPYSSNAASNLVLGHRTTHGLAFIDTNPQEGSTDYSLNGFGPQNPDIIAAACWR